MMENQLPNGERLIEEPTYPEEWECCNNGCEELCVYEIYRVQKQAYDEQQKRLKSVPKTTQRPRQTFTVDGLCFNKSNFL